MSKKPNKPQEDGIHMLGDGMAYMQFANAAVIKASDNREMFAMPADFRYIPQADSTGLDHKMIPWGSTNTLPQDIITKASKVPDITSNHLFNVQLGYGSGIIPVRVQEVDTSKHEVNLKYVPVLDNAEINQFFEDNDINGFLREQLVDMNYFFNCFPEIILNMDDPDKRKIIEISSKEAAFSRWTMLNEKGHIPYHLYSGKWGQGNNTPADVIATEVLSPRNTILDLKRRIGREPLAGSTKKVDDRCFRYIIPARFPVPGRTYYSKPPWYALIESGWYDFALLIPEFKRALLNNQMTIKYIVYLHENYFDEIFKTEGQTTDKEKRDRIKLEYNNIQNFLSGAPNTGKGTISRIKYTPDGKEVKMVQIVPVENMFKGGEYIEDSEEVSNIIAYGMGVHASLIGSHGKGGTISGSETRELFIIKQAIQKSLRDLLLKPLYVAKAINKWDPTIQFVIPNLQLTTLDQGTGAEKKIS